MFFFFVIYLTIYFSSVFFYFPASFVLFFLRLSFFACSFTSMAVPIAGGSKNKNTEMTEQKIIAQQLNLETELTRKYKLVRGYCNVCGVYIF